MTKSMRITLLSLVVTLVGGAALATDARATTTPACTCDVEPGCTWVPPCYFDGQWKTCNYKC
jgi:hypothetical protein